MADISDHGEAAKVFPITERPTFELLTEAGEFTSACSVTPYTGDAFFDGEYRRSTFVAEPVHNLVHRDVIEPDGGGFRARRGERGPRVPRVDRRVVPAGQLLCRPGRRALRHRLLPEAHRAPGMDCDGISEESLAEFALGADRGRIYRIVPDGPVGARAPSSRRRDNATLVSALSRGTLWWRRTAERLLIERKARRPDRCARRTREEADHRSAKLHALWTLNALGRLPDALIVATLGDAEPGLRENALQLAEPRLTTPAVASAVLARAGVETGSACPLSDDRDVRLAACHRSGDRADARCCSITSTISGLFGRR